MPLIWLCICYQLLPFQDVHLPFFSPATKTCSSLLTQFRYQANLIQSCLTKRILVLGTTQSRLPMERLIVKPEYVKWTWVNVTCWNIQGHNFFGCVPVLRLLAYFLVRWNRVCHTRKIQEPRARANPRDLEKMKKTLLEVDVRRNIGDSPSGHCGSMPSWYSF